MTDFFQPRLVAIAGPNGAGKTTFYRYHLSDIGLDFINADEIAREEGCDALAAAKEAEARRVFALEKRESFVFETVLSERRAAGGKIEFLRLAESQGFDVTLVFIGLDTVEKSKDRVLMRKSKGGHDVPDEKLEARYPRCMKNLARAIRRLSHVEVYDNSVLNRAHRRIAVFEEGKAEFVAKELPGWFLRAMSEGGISIE